MCEGLQVRYTYPQYKGTIPVSESKTQFTTAAGAMHNLLTTVDKMEASARGNLC